VADHPLRPATDRRLGRPLPYQLANPTSAHPSASGLAVPNFDLSISCGISSSFPELSPTKGQIPMYSSPVRRSPPDCSALPLDLHVLGMPPAFNLSQDQTLQFITCGRLLTAKIFQLKNQNSNSSRTVTYLYIVCVIQARKPIPHIVLLITKFPLLGRFHANQVHMSVHTRHFSKI
jgi:hypothetical protein